MSEKVLSPDGGVAGCELCAGLGWLRVNAASVNDKNFGRLVPCPCRAKELTETRNARLDAVSGLTPNERALSVADFAMRCQDTPAMVEIVEQFIAEPWGFLTLWGGPGNGKTLALMAIVNDFKARGHVAVYVTMTDLVDWVRAGNDKAATADARERYQLVKTAHVLAIDEVDKLTHVTDYADEFRARLFDDRYRAAVAATQHTVMAMNRHPNSLPGPLQDRLRDGRFVIFENRDPSMRPAMARPQAPARQEQQVELWRSRADINGG